MSVFANLFGYVLNFLYKLVSNYGIAIILFSILIKIIMMPLTIKQQKALKKNEVMNKEMKQIQFKYKNDPEKMNQEIMSLYKREGMSPFSGCFSSIIQIILLFSVFLLVRSPLTYMVKMDPDVISKMEDIVIQQEEGSRNNTYSEIAVIQYVRNLESTSSVDKTQENEENNNNTENNQNSDFNIYDYIDQVNINMDFFGIDLSQVPTKDLKNWKTLIIPLLYVITSFLSIKFTTATSKNKKKNSENNKKEVIKKSDDENKENTEDTEENKEEYDPMESANKTMVWIMPIMSVSIAIIAPLGLALYWLTNNILMIIERIILNKIFDKEEGAKKDA